MPARPAGHPRPPHAALQQPVPVPPSSDPPPEASYHEASSRVHGRSPVRPSPRLWPPGGAGALGLIPPELHTPPSPAAHVGVGTGNLGTCLSYVTISWSSSQRSHSPRATSCRTDLIRACPPSGAAPPCLVRPQQASNTVRFPAQDRLDNHRSIVPRALPVRDIPARSLGVSMSDQSQGHGNGSRQVARSRSCRWRGRGPP